MNDEQFAIAKTIEPQSRLIIEVACEVKLRDQHQLRDGDVVEVELTD